MKKFLITFQFILLLANQSYAAEIRYVEVLSDNVEGERVMKTSLIPMPLSSSYGVTYSTDGGTPAMMSNLIWGNYYNLYYSTLPGSPTDYSGKVFSWI
jgi:hypothetical protein